MKNNIYFWLAIIGVILPYTQFVPWSNANGLNLRLMVEEMFANQIASGIAIDALLTALVILIFIFIDRKKVHVKYLWVPIAGIFISGISFALPMYLYLRERTLKQGKAD